MCRGRSTTRDQPTPAFLENSGVEGVHASGAVKIAVQVLGHNRVV